MLPESVDEESERIEALESEVRKLHRRLERANQNLARLEERRAASRDTLLVMAQHRTSAEKNLRRAQDDLERSEGVARESTEAKSRFLANMSHELRTPLNAIIGYSELLAECQEDSPEEVACIRRAGLNLLAIINDILDLSRVESGSVSVEEIEIPVQCFVEGLVDEVIPELERRELTIDVKFLGPDVVYSDPRRLRQVFTNILSNAVKFTNKGGIRVTVRNEQEGVYCFEVTDSGIGMTQEQVRRVFDPFVQADLSTTRRFGGTGLGLTIAHRMCDLLGGTLAVDSVPGVGSRFMARLPVGSAPPAH